MKKLLVFTALSAFALNASAQKSKVYSAQNYAKEGKLDKAYEAINGALDPNYKKADKILAWPKTFIAKGQVMRSIATTKNKSYDGLKKQLVNPLDSSLTAYIKAASIDEGNRYSKEIKAAMMFLITDFTNAGAKAYEVQDYKGASDAFVNVLRIEENPVYIGSDKAVIDTVIMYNIAVASSAAKMYDRAIEYYNKTQEVGYNGEKCALGIINAYKAQNDSVKALEAMQDAFHKYPTDQGILVELINYYIQSKNVEGALTYLDKAIASDPKNPSYYFAKGSVYDNLGDPTKAIEAYNKAIEAKSDFADAYYNLGAVFYNKGVKLLEVANSLPTSEVKKYEAQKELANVEFEKAVPYFEKAAEINPKEKATFENLKNLYYRLGMNDKYDVVMKKMKELE
ncbi:tetratricopeptide repeat protein [Halosquirtibacter xylanolyticus]|uniref:tetratricopeptide repeat protein n=1 Tax=Halosquirtibacter xylanolyticus TaxID=3374599 RepID=UPI00374A6298|nr:tetratricopeptide repeat protein [Prolixibacteraceae bacterium]